jgi:hypothetical protein
MACLEVDERKLARARRRLEETGSHLPDQKGRPTARPTLRWVFQLFIWVRLVELEGRPLVLRGSYWCDLLALPGSWGKVVEIGWREWMGRVRNWVSPAGAILLETRFSVMVRPLGLHWIEARSYLGLLARVNLILLVHNLIRSRVSLGMAGMEL